MSWLQFTDSMFGRLAWPLVVLLIVFAVRKHLGSLAERILELSFGGATVKFGQLLSKGSNILEHAPPAPSLPQPAPAPVQARIPGIDEIGPLLPPPLGTGAPLSPEVAEILRRLVGLTHPTPATTAPFGVPSTPLKYEPWMIVAEYSMLEVIFSQIGELLHVKTRHGDTLMGMLYKRGLVSAEAVELHKTLRQARNEVAHNMGSPSESQIAEYQRQATYLREVLLDANRQLAAEQARRDSGPRQTPPED